MKNICRIAFALLFLVSCEEEPPGINYTPTKVAFEETYIDASNVPTPQLREVLVEDISGVRCVNCPDAAIIAGLPTRDTDTGIISNLSGLPKNLIYAVPSFDSGIVNARLPAGIFIMRLAAFKERE